jgi:hypothetical protein
MNYKLQVKTMDSCINPHSSTSDSYYDSRSIKSKKYKTIGILKQACINSIIQTTSRMDASSERDYLDKWLYDTHYSKKEMYGMLTDRIENISNKICYREIIKRCFNDIDILSSNTTKQILSKPSIDFITELHSISPSIVGSFIDYLVRRIISELTGKEFRDRRCESGSHSHICRTKCDSLCAKSHNATCTKSSFTHICTPVINYNDKTDIELKQLSLDMGFSQINTGSAKPTKITKRNINENLSDSAREILIKTLNSITNKCKYDVNCQLTCKEDMTTLGNICILPKCQLSSYQKTKNTLEYKTEHIVEDIFITSLFHSEAFLQAPKQEHFNEVYEKLTTNDAINDILIKPMTDLCKDIIKDKSDIFLNPAFGGDLDDVEGSIPADADLVVDDLLIDIKCTKKSNPIGEITQLLGYSSLMMLDKKYRRNINKISIINMLSGIITTYNIDFVDKDNCVNYIKVLTN